MEPANRRHGMRTTIRQETERYQARIEASSLLPEYCFLSPVFPSPFGPGVGWDGKTTSAFDGSGWHQRFRTEGSISILSDN